MTPLHLTPKEIKAARIAFNMSEASFAKRCGLTGGNAKDTVHKWESGRLNPSAQAEDSIGVELLILLKWPVPKMGMDRVFAIKDAFGFLRARSFVVSLRLSPHIIYREDFRVIDGNSVAAAKLALAFGEKLEAEHQNTANRKSLMYAVTPEGRTYLMSGRTIQ